MGKQTQNDYNYHLNDLGNFHGYKLSKNDQKYTYAQLTWLMNAWFVDYSVIASQWYRDLTSL